MSNEQKSLVDQILDKLRNNPLIATLIVIGISVIAIEQFFGAITSLVGRVWPEPNLPSVCRVDKNFAVQILFADGRRKIKDKIKQNLEGYGYFDSSTNTDFSEFDDPGNAGTAWVIYPRCISKEDDSMRAVINILEDEGFREDENLRVFQSSRDNFQKVQISLF